MKQKTLFDSAMGLCTVGGALFAIGASREPVSQFIRLPPTAFIVLMVVGGILAAAGGLAFALSYVIGSIKQVVVKIVYGDVDSKYVCAPAQSGDLNGLHALYARHFGDDVPSVELMQSWISKCPTAFVLVNRVVQDSGLATHQELVGSFKLLPLNAKGVQALEQGQATGSTFLPVHISSGRTPAGGYWVGDVVGTTPFASAVVLAHLNATITETLKRSASSTLIYARPLTSDGLRVMTGHGFVQVSDGRSAPQLGRSCKLHTAAAVQRRPAHSRRRKLTPIAMEAADA